MSVELGDHPTGSTLDHRITILLANSAEFGEELEDFDEDDFDDEFDDDFEEEEDDFDYGEQGFDEDGDDGDEAIGFDEEE